MLSYLPAILVVIAVLVIIAIVQSRSYRNSLQFVAARIGGRVVAGGVFSQSSVQWTVDGIPAELQFYEGDAESPPATRIRFDTKLPGSVRIAPEGMFTGLRKLLGTQDISIGDPSFDKEFLIQGAPEKWVRKTLSSELRARLGALAEMSREGVGRRALTLEAGPVGLSVLICTNLLEGRERLVPELKS